MPTDDTTEGSELDPYRRGQLRAMRALDRTLTAETQETITRLVGDDAEPVPHHYPILDQED